MIGNPVRIGSSPTFLTVLLSSLTASRTVATNASKQLVSTTLASWITGTATRVTVTDNGSGGVTLSAPNTPTYQGLILDHTYPWLTVKESGVIGAYFGVGAGLVVGATGLDAVVRTGNSAGSIIFGVSTAERARITGQNLLLGLTAAGTSAAKVLGIADGTAPSTSVTGVQIYSLAGVPYFRTSGGKIINLDQGAAIADATDLATALTSLNSLLAQMRTRGLIAT